MPITYDIETDYLYNKGIAKGLEKGLAKGLEKGREEGIEKKTQVFVMNLLSETDMGIEQIAKVADVSVSLVTELKQTLAK
jgi:predicted transposase YdaD